MIAILSPAKRLNDEPEGAPKRWTLPRFMEDTELLLEELREYDVDGLKSLMNVSDKIAELNHQRFAEWHSEFSPRNARRAVLAFQGDVYQGLNAGSLSEEELERSQAQLRVLSGLYGILRPLDLIQPYRLEMSTKLANPRGKDLYAFWKDRVTEQLKMDLKESGSEVLVDLASNEYSKAVDKKELGVELITPKFMERKGGEYRTVAIKAKKARGLMARFMIENALQEPEGLQAFDLEGYRFNEGMSELGKGVWVFTSEK